MATVSGITGTSGTSGSSQTSQTSQTSQSGKSSATAQASVDYNTFLKLLLAQLKNQDPTKPMDSTEYMSQLASFSNVEQGMKMNTKLDDLLTRQSLTQAENLIGKSVSNADGTVTGVVKSVKVTASGATATLTNGKTLVMGEGVSISATPASASS